MDSQWSPVSHLVQMLVHAGAEITDDGMIPPDSLPGILARTGWSSSEACLAVDLLTEFGMLPAPAEDAA